MLIIILGLIRVIYCSPCHGTWNGTYCSCFSNWENPITNCSTFNDSVCIQDCFYGSIDSTPCICSCDSINYHGDTCNNTNTCESQCMNGTCLRDNPPDNELPTCNCTLEYEGDWCDVKIVNNEDSGDSGEIENVKSDEPKTDDDLTIVQIIVSIVGSTLTCAGFCVYCHKHHEKEKFRRNVVESQGVFQVNAQNVKEGCFDKMNNRIYKIFSSIGNCLGNIIDKFKKNDNTTFTTSLESNVDPEN